MHVPPSTGFSSQKDAVAVDRGEDDDATAAVFPQMRDRVFYGEERPLDIDILGLVPLFRGQVFNGSAEGLPNE